MNEGREKEGRRGDGKGGERKERREKEKGSVPGSFSQILAAGSEAAPGPVIVCDGGRQT